MSDEGLYSQRMNMAQQMCAVGLYSVACWDAIKANKIAKHTRTGAPRTGDAWERRAQFASACWIAAQRLSGGTRDTQEET